MLVGQLMPRRFEKAFVLVRIGCRRGRSSCGAANVFSQRRKSTDKEEDFYLDLLIFMTRLAVLSPSSSASISNMVR